MSEVTNERKVSILEKLLLERDEQIRKLQEENAELEKEIESFGNSMLKIGEDYISSNKFTKKQTQQIKEIISETKKLMTTVR